MPELKDRFRALDDLAFDEPMPSVDRGERRAPIDLGPSLTRRIGVALLALAVGAAGFVLAVRAFGGDAPRPNVVAAAGGRVAIATYSYGEEPSSIYLMNEDGGELTLLAEGRDASWSPDGTRIAFRTGNPDRPGAETRVNVINADGSGLTTLEPVRWGEASGEAGPPVWSPDGSLIAFDTLGGIYVMHPDGTGVRRVSQYEGQLSCYDLEPSWSPDGSRLVFAVLCDGGNEGIWVVNVDGSEKTQILAPSHDGLYAMEQPAWSPDGSRIAFEGIIRDGDDFTSFLYTMKSDGTDVTQLTEGTAGSVGDPAWSPDGTRIAYTDYSSTDVRIILMNADGSDPRELPTGGIQACCLAWGPAEESISEQSTGYDLAEELGLGEPVPTREGLGSGCKGFAEVVDGQGYCLDGVASNADEMWELATRIGGHVPSADETRLHQLMEQLNALVESGADDDNPDVSNLIDQIRELQAKIRASE